MHAYREAVKGKRQKKEQTAVNYIAHIRELGYQHLVGVPTSEEIFLIIETMTEEHQANMLYYMDSSRASLERNTSAKPISFMDIENWARPI